jgi:hypothetical protein
MACPTLTLLSTQLVKEKRVRCKLIFVPFDIMIASDHFFETPVENLKHYAAAAKECVY